MILNKTSLVVPHKIRRLLKKYDLGVVFLNSSKFKHMLKIWRPNKDTIAVAVMQANMIMVDEERVKRLKLPQTKINYLILHEIGHNGKRHWSEQGAHTSALGFARYYNIPIDYSGVALD